MNFYSPGVEKKAYFTQGKVIKLEFASVAQLAEQLTLNQLVRGSSPCGGTQRQANFG